jgi:hypothetical protein
MKKKTVITTEKHETWVIRQVAERQTARAESPDVANCQTPSLVPTVDDEPDPIATTEDGEP